MQDHLDLAGAVATRVQADVDVHIISGARGSGLDPNQQAVRGRLIELGISRTDLGES